MTVCGSCTCREVHENQFTSLTFKLHWASHHYLWFISSSLLSFTCLSLVFMLLKIAYFSFSYYHRADFFFLFLELFPFFIFYMQPTFKNPMILVVSSSYCLLHVVLTITWFSMNKEQTVFNFYTHLTKTGLQIYKGKGF